MEIYSTQYGVLIESLVGNSIDPSDIAAIGITNQRETTIVWDKDTGKPIYNAIVWQCRRTAGLCEELKKDEAFTEYVKEHTGLLIDAYFSATKIQWILDHVEGARERAQQGKLLFGTVDSWLVWKLTGGKVHVTDYTNASRTMLYNIRDLRWDETIAPGEAKNTYGTGCFLLMNTGDRLYRSENGLISTIAIGLNGKVQYALEGSVFVGGAVIQWVRDELRFITESRDAEYYAQKVPDTGGVYLVPAFTGLGAPYWDMYARGCLIGITRGTTREHIIRAAQESIAYQSYDLVEAMETPIWRVWPPGSGGTWRKSVPSGPWTASTPPIWTSPSGTSCCEAGTRRWAAAAAGWTRKRNKRKNSPWAFASPGGVLGSSFFPSRIFLRGEEDQQIADVLLHDIGEGGVGAVKAHIYPGGVDLIPQGHVPQLHHRLVPVVQHGVRGLLGRVSGQLAGAHGGEDVEDLVGVVARDAQGGTVHFRPQVVLIIALVGLVRQGGDKPLISVLVAQHPGHRNDTQQQNDQGNAQHHQQLPPSAEGLALVGRGDLLV